MKTKNNKFRVILEVWDENDIPGISIPKEYYTTVHVYQDLDEEILTQMLKERFKEILDEFVSRENKDESNTKNSC